MEDVQEAQEILSKHKSDNNVRLQSPVPALGRHPSALMFIFLDSISGAAERCDGAPTRPPAVQSRVPGPAGGAEQSRRAFSGPHASHRREDPPAEGGLYLCSPIVCRGAYRWFWRLVWCGHQVERLKAGLQEAEQAKVKLLERAKRHVSTDRICGAALISVHIPEKTLTVVTFIIIIIIFSQQIIHQTNQQKTENELQILNHMINKVREVRHLIQYMLFSLCSLCFRRSLMFLFPHADSPLCARSREAMWSAAAAGGLHRLILTHMSGLFMLCCSFHL